MLEASPLRSADGTIASKIASSKCVEGLDAIVGPVERTTAAMSTTGDSTAANASRSRDRDKRQRGYVALAHRHLAA
eukprot:1677204-Pyramimonas_sp.AAC.1